MQPRSAPSGSGYQKIHQICRAHLVIGEHLRRYNGEEGLVLQELLLFFGLARLFLRSPWVQKPSVQRHHLELKTHQEKKNDYLVSDTVGILDPAFRVALAPAWNEERSINQNRRRAAGHVRRRIKHTTANYNTWPPLLRDSSTKFMGAACPAGPYRGN